MLRGIFAAVVEDSSTELSELDQLDVDLSRAFIRQVVNLINDNYFRTRLIGFDQWDERNNPAAPLIFVSNHSGMALPWDAVAFVAMLFRRHGYSEERTMRTLITPFFTRVGLLSLYQVPYILTRSGGIEATMRNFEKAMQLPDGHVLIYPEGLRGIGKGFDRRYELQRVSSSVVRMALRFDTEIVHFASVNGEYVHPFAYRSELLNRIGKRVLGLPFLPLTILLPFILLQPWVFYMAFPARLTFVRKSRLNWRELTERRDVAAIDEQEIQAMRERLQTRLQSELYEAEEAYGREPFRWKSFWRQFWRNLRTAPLWFPIGWPLLFWAFERQGRQRREAEGPLINSPLAILQLFFRMPWLLAYYLPVVGWIPILIWSQALSLRYARERSPRN